MLGSRMNDVSAIRWVFFLQPFILGAWFPRIPQVQATLELSAGQLAFALIGMPIGLLTALSVGPRLAEALGTRRPGPHLPGQVPQVTPGRWSQIQVPAAAEPFPSGRPGNLRVIT